LWSWRSLKVERIADHALRNRNNNQPEKRNVPPFRGGTSHHSMRGAAAVNKAWRKRQRAETLKSQNAMLS
jgi:hypothetical protein